MSRSLNQEGREPLEPRVARLERTPREMSRVANPALSPADLELLRETIDRVSQDRPSFSEFVERLKQVNVCAVPSLQKSGHLNGMSYDFAGVRVKGSDLGRAYTAQGLQRAKGLQYVPERDDARLQEAVRQGRENRPVRAVLVREETPERAVQIRQYDRLRPLQRAALRDMGRFRTVAAADLLRVQYHGDAASWRRDLNWLMAQQLVERRSVVVATHAKQHGRTMRTLAVVVLTKKGKDLLRACDQDVRRAHQAVYAGFVKPREVAHDAAIYRMYQAEAAKIEAGGGRVRRVVLDFELKRRVYRPLAQARRKSGVADARLQARVAQEHGLHVVQGRIRFPDLRIEYENAGGEACRVDLELATEHYRGDHMQAKDRAGFKIYADSASFPRFGAGGTDGRSPAMDTDHLIEIFSF